MVNGDISDIFFNTNLDDTVTHDDDGTFLEYDEVKLRETGRMLLASLDRLGVAVPTLDELITDFYRRI